MFRKESFLLLSKRRKVTVRHSEKANRKGKEKNWMIPDCHFSSLHVRYSTHSWRYPESCLFLSFVIVDAFGITFSFRVDTTDTFWESSRASSRESRSSLSSLSSSSYTLIRIMASFLSRGGKGFGSTGVTAASGFFLILLCVQLFPFVFRERNRYSSTYLR